MKHLHTVLILLVVSGIGLDVIVRLKRMEERLQIIDDKPIQKPIRAMLRDMSSNGRVISDDQAKAVSMEVWKRLWGTDHNVDFHSCRWNEQSKTWVVQIGFYDPRTGVTSGSGCAVTISESGELEKVESCQEM